VPLDQKSKQNQFTFHRTLDGPLEINRGHTCSLFFKNLDVLFFANNQDVHRFLDVEPSKKRFKRDTNIYEKKVRGIGVFWSKRTRIHD
jgi:hypothetical protein